MPNLKGIPEATWRRLAALEPQCHFSMTREDEWLVAGAGGRMMWSGIGGPPSVQRRSWRVRIRMRDAATPIGIIDTSEPHLADALLAAIEEAERRGWHRATVKDGSTPPPDVPAIDRRAAEKRDRAAYLQNLSDHSHGIGGGSDPSRGRYRDLT